MENLFIHIRWKMQELNRLTRKGAKENLKINYIQWKPAWKEEIRYCAEGFGMICIVAYFFYRSVVAVIVLMPGIWFYRRERIKQARMKRKIVLEQQFKETLLAVQTNLQSGHSIENAFIESGKYVIEVYGKDCDMVRELLWIKKGISNGVSMEHMLLDLGKRCPESALEDFANIYSIACRSGGGWTQVIVKIVSSISQRMELKQEIESMIHGKKLESRIMCIVPFFILFYMDITSKGYFDILYHNPAGIVIMTVCLGVYLFAFILAEKITEI